MKEVVVAARDQSQNQSPSNFTKIKITYKKKHEDLTQKIHRCAVQCVVYYFLKSAV